MGKCFKLLAAAEKTGLFEYCGVRLFVILFCVPGSLLMMKKLPKETQRIMCGITFTFTILNIFGQSFLFYLALVIFTCPEASVSVFDCSVRAVEIVCALLKSYFPSLNGAIMMSMGINILTKMMRW